MGNGNSEAEKIEIKLQTVGAAGTVIHCQLIDLYRNDTIDMLKKKITLKLFGDASPPSYREILVEFKVNGHVGRKLYSSESNDKPYDIFQKLDRFHWALKYPCIDFDVRTQIKNEFMIKHLPSETTCDYVNRDGSCPVYDRLRKYKFCDNDLKHMMTYNHWKLSPKNCKHGIECNALQRLMDKGNRLDDRCHMFVFNHPPRRAQSNHPIPPDFNPFIFAASLEDLKIANLEDIEINDDEQKQSLLDALMDEVIKKK
eukprot:129533_1